MAKIKNKFLETPAAGEDYGYLRNIALQNALDILEMQAAETLESGQSANLIRDVFADANGYLNTVNTDETDALYDAVGLVYLNSEEPTWSEVQPAGDADKNWYSVSVSGSTIVACVYGGRLYVSTNSGTNWSEVQPAGDANKNWNSVSVSGSTIVVGINNGRLYGYISIGASNFFIQTLEKSLETTPTHFQVFAWKPAYTLTGNITIDVSFNGGTNYQTGIELDTPTEIINTGTEMILKINLNKGASDGEASLKGYGVMLWGEA